MQAVVLSRVSQYDGSTVICGVFSNMDAVIERLRIVSSYFEPSEEYRIEGFNLTTYKEQKDATAEVFKSRAEHKAKMAKLNEDN
jgi:hypothetical protein